MKIRVCDECKKRGDLDFTFCCDKPTRVIDSASTQ